jgi:hypothetical protein
MAARPSGCVLGPVLYLIYTSDFPTPDNTTTAPFADDTVILATHEEPEIASMKVQQINEINEWAKKRRTKVNQNSSTHISLTLRNQACPTVQMGNVASLPEQAKRSEIPAHAA